MGALLGEALQRAFAANGDRVRFIQIGGNDGVHEDPLYQYHLDRTFDFEWGQIYEPIPEYFELLEVNMRPFPYVTCHPLAVDDADGPGQREFNYVSPKDIEERRLPPSSKGIGSFSRDRNALGGVGYNPVKFGQIKDYIRTIQVRTVPARDVVAEYANANFLITDCEGHDAEIIRAAFNGTGFRPKVVQFENLGHDDELLKATLNDLTGAGYRVIGSGKDVICELI
jgi:FkbM family methyltransferase